MYHFFQWLLFFVFAIFLTILSSIHIDLLKGLPSPNLLLCWFFAWFWRCPQNVSMIGVVLAFLVADILTMHPAGLSALSILIVFWCLKTQTTFVQSVVYNTSAFHSEWLMTTLLMFIFASIQAILFLLIWFTWTSPILILSKTLITSAFYPVVVGVVNGLRIYK